MIRDYDRRSWFYIRSIMINHNGNYGADYSFITF